MEQLGPYRVLEELGRGGMGVVYRGQDVRDGRPVALKVLLDPAAGPEALERFRRETVLLQDVEHPNLVRVLEVNFAPPRPYAAFEYVEGGTLRARVEREGPLPWRTAARALSEVAAGVAAAHERGLLHRDVKPDNVLLGPEGAKLGDFGLVKDLDQDTLTQSGATVGSPNYLAPEQIGAEKARWGEPTDVYGLAATLYFALTGQPPFVGPNQISILLAVQEQPPPAPRALNPEVPAWLDAVCRRGLAKLGSERYPSALAFRAALAAPHEAPRRGWVLVLALGAVALAGAVAVAIRPPATTPTPPPTPPATTPTPPEGLLAELDRRVAENPRDPAAYATRAAARRKQQRPLEALQDYDQALALAPTASWLFLERGTLREALDQGRAALRDYGRTLELDPSNVEAYVKRGTLRARLDDVDGALADFDRALELAPSFGKAYRLRGDAKAQRNRHAEAIEDYDRAHELNPRDVRSLLNRAAAHKLLGRYEAALADLDAALALDPALRYGLLHRAELHALLNRPEQALVDLDRGVELDPADPLYYVRRAATRAQLRQSQEAVEDYTRAIELGAAEAQVYEQRGIAQFRLQRYPEAIADFTRALELDPA
ncbi:MAG: tetratricopeptide repeat protein, partial [Planctomycetes bacterium]|nr:tetratricopeptide repeat protein [Planctomycetota bacterium]